jgi:hypothetical protein
MYKLEFTLKQHTPLIHFQHDQEGATLRATEVKPKLDKFVIEKLTNRTGIVALDEFRHKTTKKIRESSTLKDNPDFENKWLDKLVGKSNEHLALNYKLKIWNETKHTKKFFFTSNPDSQRNDPAYENTIKSEFEAKYIKKTQYFANNSNLKPNRIESPVDVKLGIQTDVLKAEILSVNPGIISVLESCLSDFFLSQNFASRQSKGFGCFTVDSLNGSPMPFDENELLNCYSVVYKCNTRFSSQIDALQQISQFYKLIRSGQGRREPGGYKKSLLFLYFVAKSNPIRWEKRKIKQQINLRKFNYRNHSLGRNEDINLTYTDSPCFDASNSKDWNDTPNTYNYKYIRALLGLNETFEFLADSIIDGIRADGSANEIKFKYIAQIKSNNGIERYKSPITCKFINGYIYFCCNQKENKILNSSFNPVSFNIDLRLKKNNTLQDAPAFKRDNLVSNLETPDQFDISEFLRFCFVDSPVNKIESFELLQRNTN